MSVHKVVIRLDFARACFALLDRAGAICDKLADIPDVKADSGEKFFQQIQESTANRLFSGQRKAADGSEFILFQISPLNLACHWELSTGIRFEDLGRDERVQKLMRFSYELLTELKITKFSRAGIRFHYLGDFSSENKMEALGKKFDADLLQHINRTLGSPTDYGFSVNGTGDDKIHYRLNFGPYFSDQESLRFFENVGPAMVGRKQDNLVFDLDLYEQNLVLQVNPSKWATPLIDKAKRLVDGVIKSLDPGIDHGNVA
ncbi:TPA: hypothetical protein QDB44_001314 [Burkholderia vietnamiensis]|uniref:hypothetical protein n=1 Tax=Burkholderia vietnamiensis TaxID=60552 RepID=UPI001CF274CD|nr:hypothetical protein [Burkholderia vietnamiensis]MCA8230754.1 hypothetical protein [Burkholderia vietnamiensis]HDR9051332.1 hypothetical protein [Burkholderia vietnamiensis]HDR9232231.1 hypothetical protein [Burkholderia vietnamiensis]HDR9355471.1 hypothetical protein [Burkholderia vietnamiensis]